MKINSTIILVTIVLICAIGAVEAFLIINGNEVVKIDDTQATVVNDTNINTNTSTTDGNSSNTTTTVPDPVPNTEPEPPATETEPSTDEGVYVDDGYWKN